jgi:hypothetical protein
VEAQDGRRFDREGPLRRRPGHRVAGGVRERSGGQRPRGARILGEIRRVRVVDVVGWDSMWPIAGPGSIRADLRVGSNGRLLLCDLTPETFSGTRPFILARVGDWAPVVHAERDLGRRRFVAGCPNSVDIGPGSAFLELVPFPLLSPADVVATTTRSTKSSRRGLTGRRGVPARTASGSATPRYGSRRHPARGKAPASGPKCRWGRITYSVVGARMSSHAGEFHSNRWPQDRGELVKVRITLDRDAPYDAETLWARPIGDGVFIVDNVPFFAYGLSLATRSTRSGGTTLPSNTPA